MVDTRWSYSLLGGSLVALALAGCEPTGGAPPPTPQPVTSIPEPAAPTTAPSSAEPPSAPAATPLAAPATSATASPDACPDEVRAQLDRLATCFRQAVTALQREPAQQPLGTFLKTAALPSPCDSIGRDGTGAALVAGKPVLVERSESHDNYGQGRTALLVTYSFGVADCGHRATTTVDRHFGGRP